MKNKSHIKFLLSLACLVMVYFLMSSAVFAQTILATLEGKVSDNEGGALPGATITIKNMQSGYINSSISRPDGSYVISGIQPGKYECKAALSGFATQIMQGITIAIGARLTINFALSPSQIAKEITVTAEAPMVEMSKSDVSNVVDRQKIDDLPLYNRNFEDLTLLVAGVQEGRANAQPDSMGEQRIDGVSNESAGMNDVRTNLPVDAIQEFRVITNQFEAEYGNASGLLWNAISRSGTNEFRGRVSFFSRNKALDAVNYFVNHPEYNAPELPKDQWEKADYNHYNFGGYIGGPIIKDKLHFFIAYEGTRHTEYSTITSPLVPHDTVNVTTNDNKYFLKLSYQLNEKNLFSFRFSHSKTTGDNWYVGGYATKERAVSVDFPGIDFQANWTFFPSDKTLNELRVLYGRSHQAYTPPAPYDTAYMIDRPSGGFGSAWNYPQDFSSERYEAVDTFSLFLEKHSIKLGLDYSNIPSWFYIQFFIPGYFIFLTDAQFNPKDPATYPFLFMYNSGSPKFPKMSLINFGAFVQDSWKIHRRLTLNIGLRYNYYYYRGYDINNASPLALNPRFGFSWDPVGDGKSAIRGGFGTYSANPSDNSSSKVFAMKDFKLNQIFFPGYPDPFSPNPFVPSIHSVSPDQYIAEKNMIAPYTVQATLGFQREVITDLSISADLVWARGHRELRQDNLNPIIPGTGYIHKDPTQGNIWLTDGRGRSDYKGLYLTFSKRYSHGWTLDVTYTLSKSMGDTEGDLANPHSYDPNAWETQYGPTDRDARHRLSVTGTFDLPFGFQLSTLFYYRSALPWTAVYSYDRNQDGLISDYVDAYRNARRGFDNYYLNARISKYIKISQFSRVQLFGELYNLTDKTNFTTIATVLDASGFANPIAADIPRLIQFGIRLDF